MAVCSPIMHDTAVAADLVSADIAAEIENSVTYHFRVPFLSLLSGAEVQKLLLLPMSPANYAEDACAYFILDEPITIPDVSGNFTIIIDWTLTFTNN